MRRLALAALFVFAFALRSSGLSHDLSEGYVYHPDSPKQMAAAQRFLRGQYYFHTGNHDVDGYPYLNSHLVELSYRAYRSVANGVLAWTGVRGRVDPVPQRVLLHWFARYLNVTLSALAVVVLTVLALEAFGPRVAIVAGLLMALSPLDVVACHEANSDATAAFFAALTLLFSCRVRAHGRIRDYVLATLCSTAAFAAKYHGAASFFALVVAHVTYVGGWRSLFSAASLRRTAVVLAAGVIGLCLTIPPLLTHPFEITRDILDFLQWVARPSRLPQEAQGGMIARFTFSMVRNPPLLAWALGWPLAAVAALGLARLRRDRSALAVLYAMPVVYFFVGIAFRPLAPAVNHVIVSAPLLLIAVVVLDPWLRASDPRRRVPVVALMAVSIVWLALTTARELFFYDLPDTRLLAREWTRENVPETFAVKSKGYGFQWAPTRSEGAQGRVYVVSDLRRKPLPPGVIPLKTFFLERASLDAFRNTRLEVSLETPLLAPDFVRPMLPQLPAESGNEVIFEGREPFYRSAKVVELQPGRPLRRVFVSTQPLREALLVLRGGGMATRVRVSFAGSDSEVDLGPEEIRLIPVESPRRRFPFDRDAAFYHFAAESMTGRAWVEIATSPLERGVALFRAGQLAEASVALRKAARGSRDVSVAALALVAADASGTKLRAGKRERLLQRIQSFGDSRTREELDRAYGGVLSYLEHLEYVAAEAEDLRQNGFRVVEDRDASSGRALGSRDSGDRLESARALLPLPVLEAGIYRVRWRMRGAGTVTVSVVDRLGRARATERREARAASGYLEHELVLDIADRAAEARLELEVREGAGVVLDRIGIEPDVAAMAARFVALAEVAVGGSPPHVELSRGSYPALVALGQQAAAAGDGARAASVFRAALALRPELAPALEGLASLDPRFRSEDDPARMREIDASREARRLRPVRAGFAGGLQLVGYRLDGQVVRRGGEIGLDLYFAAPPASAALGDLVVWIHFLDDEGRVAFGGDRRLADYLRLERDPLEVTPWFHRIPVPADVRPGEYRVEVGLWNPDTGRKLKRHTAMFGDRRKGIELADRLSVRVP